MPEPASDDAQRIYVSTAKIDIRTVDEHELDVLQRVMPSSERFGANGRTNSHAMRYATQVAGTAAYLIGWREGDPAAHVLMRWTGATDAFLRSRNAIDPYIEALAVRPDLQSIGIGTAMLAEAERRTLQRGFTTIALAVGVDNNGARRLYDLLGYRDAGLGDFRATWTAIDREGRETTQGETVTYMRKYLR